MKARLVHRAVVAGLIGVATTGCKEKRESASVVDPGGDAGPMTQLESVAAIVIPNCAIAGCHDAVSKTHSMDLSSPQKIYDNWVNVPGFDHCTGMNTPRVIPGDPTASLVMLKIEGNAVCAQSQRMPLPPRPALTPAQIQLIRDWINAGAAGGGTSPPDAGGPDAGGPDGSMDAGVGDNGLPLCSAAQPCEVGLTCSGTTCGGQWECLAHYDERLKHPCAEETMNFCGCDSVTFEASVTCPDRPWLHPGACDDGASCAKEMVECPDAAPECPTGEYPSVVAGCWGPCVPLESCRCLYHWMCPELSLNTCIEGSYRCGPNPNLADAGAP
jgi:hypothetical protein